jgi:hypothetical protein
MEPRQASKQEPKAPPVARQAPKPKLRIVKLEERIAPAIVGDPIPSNHNETLVRDRSAKAR